MALSVSPSLGTAHGPGAIHAAQLDHFGKRLATASGDGRIRVCDVGDDGNIVSELHGHDMVWSLAWSHPMLGPVLAAGGDKGVILWREAEGEWSEMHSHDVGGAAIAISFCPWEYGLQLAIASSDGHTTVLSFDDDPDSKERWRVETWPKESLAHTGGVFAVCWAPAACTSADGKIKLAPRRLVTGGADSQVRIWRHDKLTNAWVDEQTLPAQHTDWVRDVAWRPNVGIPINTIASCAEDGTLVIWKQEMAGQKWEMQDRIQLSASAWQLSWSVTGSILAVSTSSNQVLLYKESLGGRWESVEAIDEG